MRLDELSWAAGLFEGEGTIQLQGGRWVRLVVQMVDEPPIRRLHETLGGRFRGPWTYDRTGQTYYFWTAAGWVLCEDIMHAWWPWLSPRRRARWLEVREHKPEPPNYPPTCGHTEPLSTAGAQRHRARGEVVCAACRDAKSQYRRARRAAGHVG
jgi:hypothetical protein